MFVVLASFAAVAFAAISWGGLRSSDNATNGATPLELTVACVAGVALLAGVIIWLTSGSSDQ